MTNHYIYSFRVPGILGEKEHFQSNLKLTNCENATAKDISKYLYDSARKDIADTGKITRQVNDNEILFDFISIVNVTEDK